MPTTQDDLKNLSKLGKKASPSRTLDTFPNHAPGQMTITLHAKKDRNKKTGNSI